uniref:HDC03539 n=1 Tax=Drosophila melanogaster TaxID=7227 RepID=Q6IH24_DROME|nr:TPA_inf: HDC03539 [Drosophila melanogaster]
MKTIDIFTYIQAEVREIKPDPGACSRRSKGIQRLWQQWRGCDIDQAAQHGDASNNKLRGIIQAVHITKRRDGQLMGCAYVRFECNELLAKSMLQENGNQLVGKAVVVDWQPELPKKRFLLKYAQLRAYGMKIANTFSI